jgi:MFS transporter, DHA2 family, multidrug resistance protein
MATWLRVREQTHSNFIGQHIESGSDAFIQVLKQFSNIFASHGAGTAPARAVASVSALVAREANVLAYADGFWLTFWLAIAALGLVALMTRAPPGPFTPAPLGAMRALRERFGWLNEPRAR